MSESFDVGNEVRITASITNMAGTLVDPTSLVFKYKQPEEREYTTYTYGENAEIVKVSTGKYRIDITVNATGPLVYRWETSGNIQAAIECTIRGKHTEF